MRSIRVGSPVPAHCFRALMAGVVAALVPALALAQSTTATVGVSLRVLSPVSSSVTPSLSMGVAREGIGSMTPVRSPAGTMSRTIATLSAADDRGTLPTRIGAPGGLRGRQATEVVVLAPALVELGLLSRDSVETTARAGAYLIQLRESPASDTAVVRIRLRYVVTVAGT
jgi:hypothetical protein